MNFKKGRRGSSWNAGPKHSTWRTGPTPTPKVACPECGKPNSAVEGYRCVACVVKLLDEAKSEKD